MKKEYISPMADVIVIETRQIIAASTLESNPGDDVKVDLSNEEYSGEAASRRRSIWDDEDEDY